MDVAASLIASDPLTGLSVDVRVRTLLVHQDEGFRERGVSVSFSYDPTPQTPLGFTARVAPSWGGQAMSGADALWGRDTMEGLGAAGPGSGDRIDAELGYALPVGSRLVGTPRFGVTTSEYGRDYRLGYSLAVVQGGAMSFQFGLDAQRRESLLQSKSRTTAWWADSQWAGRRRRTSSVPGAPGVLASVVLRAMAVPHAVGQRGFVARPAAGPVRSCGRHISWLPCGVSF